MEVLYECSWIFNTRSQLLLVGLIIVGIIGCRYTKNQGKFRRWFMRYWLFLALLMAVLSFYADIRYAIDVIGKYKRGDYLVVEGVVEHFDPMPWAGHKYESFDINGVYFHYSDYEALPTYHNSLAHGGVITGNGQRLRIKYVIYGKDRRNMICCIEAPES